MDLRGLGPHPDVVPVERDVDDPDPDRHALDAFDLLGQAPGQVVAPGRDPRQHQAAGSLVAFEYLVGDAGDGPADLPAVQQPSVLDERAHLRPP